MKNGGFESLNHRIVARTKKRPRKADVLYETKYGNFLLSRVSSIIDVKELDFRGRYGNGYFLFTMVTANKTIYERKKNVKRVRNNVLFRTCQVRK